MLKIVIGATVVLLVVCGILYVIGGTATNNAIKYFKENM
jgi:hypothetical protein